MKKLAQIEITIPSLFILATAALACIAVAPLAKAVSPPPDGGYPGGNTAEGQNALHALTTGGYNTALGWYSLFSDTTGSYNTGVGAGTLALNAGDSNTAVGTGALLLNDIATGNTAVGAFALLHNTADDNTAVGTNALTSNTAGVGNVAIGTDALANNIDGGPNTAVGDRALASNQGGFNNNAVGANALASNQSGQQNNAFGSAALYNSNGFYNNAYGGYALSTNTTGSRNSGFGDSALYKCSTGFDNTAIGYEAGQFITGDGNVCIGSEMVGAAGIDNTTWIRNVYGSVASTRIVYVDSDNHIGTLASSLRFKDDIKPMEKASEVILALKPVTFRYKKHLDASCTPMFGLIAEEVERVDPNLVTRNAKGEAETVRYDAVNAMLLNEFLKEHCRVEQLEKQIENLTAGLQKVSAQIELTRSEMKIAAEEP